MDNTRNVIFAFIGGVVVGASAAVGVMKLLAKKNSEKATDILRAENEDLTADLEDTETAGDHPLQDKPSFDTKAKPDTMRTRYGSDFLAPKPDLKELADRLIERATTVDPKTGLTPVDKQEISESMIEVHTALESYETDGYGHVICFLECGRKDLEIYLVEEQYAGEIYPLEDLTYYVRDDVLCDVLDVPIEDVKRVVSEGLGWFGKCNCAPDKLYIRNCSIGIEYEVTKVDSYYGAKIYGITDAEMESIIQSGKKGKKAREEK